uniref:inhibin alpha chain isoform X2 n=1 Tax=Doryrhamphus excisus TaxID=161450 RepID=UPI0025AE322E|nr:inhibin alpha chain isoform X2 [Doryrhamphus excisus]
MLFRDSIILAPWWILCLTHIDQAEEPSRDDVLRWFQGRILDSLGLQGPVPQRPDAGSVQAIPRRVLTTSQRQQADHQSQPSLKTSQIILFPVSGEGGTDNSSAVLTLRTSDGKLLQVVNPPSMSRPDGWMTYVLNQTLVTGPILLQVLCPDCHRHTEETDKMPFLHLRAQAGPPRPPRSVPDRIPWSPSAIDLLQRPSQERPKESDCGRAEVQISFQELGWDNWIVHPKVLTFYYCHGNCSASDRAGTILGITQCCAPVPESMRSLRITTTSDGGYSYKHETLPRIIPEECTCV